MVEKSSTGNLSPVLPQHGLIRTKLYVPPARPNLVPRPRLIERLNQVFSHKLTLISAAPGSGKTTLLTEWVPQSRHCVVWLSLEQGDNDPVRFWTYFVAALQTLNPGIGANALPLLQTRPAPPTEFMLATLLNELDRFPDAFALVLDDYHLIQAQPIHQALTFLLDHLPARIHLVVTTRADPPLNLSLLRARGELVELRAADLRFTSEEAATFLNEVMQLSLDTGDIAALETRTEGWIAGLQLAALSMTGRDDLSDFIAAFTGSHRFILDYLTDQVLARQPESIQDFLLQTSILDRLTASLCDTLTGRNDSHTVIGELDEHNLFLIPLDDERRWFRYHHLFADALHHRLRETRRESVPELHRRASEWFEREGLIMEAVNHALTGGDWRRAARLIEGATEALQRRGETATLTGWMGRLPETVRRTQPGLSLAYARALIGLAQFPEAETFVAEAEQALESNPPDDETLASLRGKALALRSNLAITKSEFARAIELSQRARQLFSSEDTAWRSFVAFNLGGAYRFSSNWVAASQTYIEASDLAQSAGDFLGALNALSMRGEVLQAQGQLHEALQQYEQILQLSRTWSMPKAPVTGYALVGLGRVWCEWNDLEAAVRFTQDGLALGNQADILDISLRGYLVLARVRQARGDPEGALAAIQELVPIVDRMGVPAVKEWIGALRAQAWLAQGKLEPAIEWATSYMGSADDAVFPAIPCALARVSLARKEPDEAIRLLDHALQAAQEVGRMGNVIQVLAVKSLAHRAQGNPDQALAALARALELAEPEGYIRVFADEGAPMARLLNRLAAREGMSSYLRQLLEVLGEAPDIEPPATGVLSEPLSKREVQVLRLIAEGATNQEIATELVLTVNTVKKHVSNIFGKLGVSNRAQAIARTRELDLI